MRKNYKGLSLEEIEKSRKKYGDNSLKKEKGKGFIKRFFENLCDPIIRILMIALAIEVIFTLGNCNIVEVLGIVSAILIATTVSTISEYGSEKAFLKIEQETSRGRVRVFRDNKIIDIPCTELVVGDITVVSRGEKIYADSEIIEGNIQVDQSALNGENREVEKYAGAGKDWSLSCPHRVFSGSIVADGEAVCKVLRVGENTYYGMVATDVQADTRISPLKLRLSKLASQISTLGYIVAGLVGFAYLLNTIVLDNGFCAKKIIASISNTRELFSTLLHALTMMITVIVVAVPEGLPMMITVVLSANMRKMVKDNILIKKMVGIETAGSLNVLFTDKTGTLTTGKLSVEAVVFEKETVKGVKALKEYNSHFELISKCAFYNTDAKLSDGVAVGGNTTERALLEFFKDTKPYSIDISEYVPFKSEIKYSTVTLADGTRIVKGAPEKILSRCKFALMPNGDIIASEFEYTKSKLAMATKKGERAIAIAVSDNKNSDNFTLVCLVLLKDKIRREVKSAVRDVEGAGIQIVMLTGDSRETAISIAEECGFFKNTRNDIALTSDELSVMSDDEVKKIIPRLRVLARALPKDKSRLVKLSQQMDLVVGMTGDGINDAPSLKLADVGFSMGSGTDIAKSASDIVILDDSFSSISKTVMYGRTIFKSIRKFVTFQLIMNLAACGITLIGQILGIDNPITIIQMLWVNIIMDTLGGLAFAGEPPLKYYMKEKPKRRDEPILTKDMIGHILSNGIFTLAILVIFLRVDFFKNIYINSDGHMTAFYALFIFSGLFNCLSARCERFFIFKGISKNKPFVFILLLISVVQLFIIYYGGELFRSKPLAISELLVAILMGMSVLLFDIIRRICYKLK